MISFQIIASSSKGNCSFLECASKHILIDAGIGIRTLERYLPTKNLSVNDLDAVFITHEHSDHCKMLEALSKYSNIAVYANEMTAEMIIASKPRTAKLKWKIFHTNDTFDFCGIRVSAFSLPHDANDTVGYQFNFEDKNFVWMTDLGYVNQNAQNYAKNANMLVLESNYDPQMLDDSDRTYSLKRRIRGSSGHLSNEDALSLLSQLDFKKIEKIYLAHISRECNDVNIIAKNLLELGDKARKIEIVNPFAELCREVNSL